MANSTAQTTKAPGLWQPRLAMGIVVTILSFAMLEPTIAVPVQHFQTANFNSMKIWQGAEAKIMRVKDRAVRYYENIRFVYQLERRVRDLEEQQRVPERRPEPAPSSLSRCACVLPPVANPRS